LLRDHDVLLHSTPRGYNMMGMIADIKRRSLHRTKILQGQMRGLEKMIENEDYCMEILTQNLAMQRSLASLNKLILENHLRTHISEDMKNPKKTDKAVNELLDLYELNNIRSK